MSRSLEIVNNLIEDINIKNKYVFERVYNAPIKASDLEKIKQDLEVLEILKKYLYLGGFDGDEDYPRDLRLEICDYSHLIDEVEEEYADYNKVKQWLEENGNERFIL